MVWLSGGYSILPLPSITRSYSMLLAWEKSRSQNSQFVFSKCCFCSMLKWKNLGQTIISWRPSAYILFLFHMLWLSLRDMAYIYFSPLHIYQLLSKKMTFGLFLLIGIQFMSTCHLFHVILKLDIIFWSLLNIFSSENLLKVLFWI